MTTLHALKLAAVATTALALGACLDDSDDGEPSAYTLVMLDGGTRDGAAPDASTSGARLALECPSAVVTEHTLGGFVARLLAVDGTPVVGAFVQLQPSTGVLVGPEPGGGTTDARGVVDFAFAAPHFDANTPISLEAITRGTDGKVAASTRCNFQIVTSGLSYAAATGTQLSYGTPTPLTVRVHARDVPPRCSDGGGVRVGFVDPARGGVAIGATGVPAASACADVADGSATVYLHAGERGGPANLEAAAASYTQSLSVLVTGAPAGITLQADDSDLARGSAANLTAKVVDDAAQPVRGIALQLQLTRCAATPCAEPEGLSPASATTLADGTARFVYFAASTAGSAQVTASIAGRPQVFASIALRVQ